MKIPIEHIIKDINTFKTCRLLCIKDIYISFAGICGLNYMIKSYDSLLTYKDIQMYTNKLGYVSRNINNKNLNLYKLQCLVIYNSENNLINLDDILNTELLNSSNSLIITNKNKVVEISKTLFNWNSLSFLEEQQLYKFIKLFNGYNHSSDGYKFINNIKKYLLTNFEPEDRERIMILSGCMFFIYGLRKPTDIDFFISNYPTLHKTKNLNELIKTDFINDDTKVEEWDAYHPEFKWKDFYADFHKTWAGSVGGKNMIECIHNPKFHFYYMGLKFVILELEIVRRNMRGRPAAVADLIALKYILGRNIKLSSISSQYYVTLPDAKEGILMDVHIPKFLNVIKFKLFKKYGISMTKEKINNLIKFSKTQT